VSNVHCTQYVAGGVGVNRAQVGEAIVAARKLDALDQVTLAELSSISARTLSDLERGSGNPTLASLLRVLDTLGLELTVK
jgi:transcriptional regulator with XRE-family HTH domain